MPRLLKDIKIDEVSSVDKGAGRRVRVMLMKRDEDAAMEKRSLFDDIRKNLAELAAWQGEHQASMDALRRDMQRRGEWSAPAPVAKAADDAVSIKKRIDDGSITKADTQAWLEERAISKSRDGETMEKAYSRLFVGNSAMDPAQDKQGAEVYRAMRQMSGSDRPVASIPMAKQAEPTSGAYELLQKAAATYRASRPDLSPAQAFAELCDTPQGRMLLASDKLSKGLIGRAEFEQVRKGIEPEAGEPSDGDADDMDHQQFQELVAQTMRDHPSLGRAGAYSKVLETPEGTSLYQRIRDKRLGLDYHVKAAAALR